MGSNALLLVAITAVLVAVAIFVLLRATRGTPEKRERRRRLLVHQQGRLGDAFVTEASETTIYYEYSVHGVQYTASQDVTALRDRLPSTPERLIGTAHLKYMPKNPANSILICEEWSGLRLPARAVAS